MGCFLCYIHVVLSTLDVTICDNPTLPERWTSASGPSILWSGGFVSLRVGSTMEWACLSPQCYYMSSSCILGLLYPYGTAYWHASHDSCGSIQAGTYMLDKKHDLNQTNMFIRTSAKHVFCQKNMFTTMISYNSVIHLCCLHRQPSR